MSRPLTDEELDALDNALYDGRKLSYNPNRVVTIEAMKRRMIGPALRKLQADISEWAAETFPGQTAESKAEHLLDEAGELLKDPTSGEEMADVLILLLNLAQMGDIDLLQEVHKKMAKNRARQWGPPDARGVYHHIDPVAPGKEEGETCAREGCAGVMGFRPVENCQCPSGNPPCSACTDNPLVCLTCGANPEED